MGESGARPAKLSVELLAQQINPKYRFNFNTASERDREKVVSELGIGPESVVVRAKSIAFCRLPHFSFSSKYSRASTRCRILKSTKYRL